MIVISLGVLAGFFFFFYRKAEYITIQVKVTNQEVLYASTLPKNSYARHFVVGDFERDAVGRVVTEVIGVESYPMSPDARVVYMDLRVRATYDTRTKTYSARGKNLMYGTPMRFSLNNVTFDGFVTRTPSTQMSGDKKVAVVEAIAPGMSPTLANQLQVGDNIKNSYGEVLAKITSIKISQADNITQNAQGDLLLRKNPIYKDVSLTLEVLVNEVSPTEVVMFDDIPFQLESIVPITTKDYTIYPSISKIVKFKPLSSQ